MAQYPVFAVGVTSEVQLTVDASHDSAGQRLANTMKSRSVRLMNLDTFFFAQYRVDSGDWTDIKPGTERFIRLDLSMHTIDLRRAAYAPPIRLRAIVKCMPTAVNAQLEVGPDAMVVQDGASQGEAIQTQSEIAAAVADYMQANWLAMRGASGAAIYQGSGEPPTDLGAADDSFIDAVTGDLYLKA